MQCKKSKTINMEPRYLQTCDGYEYVDNKIMQMFKYKGLLHRLDGPALINPNGQYWYRNGVIHRIDGPAIIFSNGCKTWVFNSKVINCSSQEEFERLLKLKAFW